MMYSEFVAGTGCKDNEANYKVFENLNVMYTYSDMTKEEIYEYGKKLVDNSKSQSELDAEAEFEREKKELRRQHDEYKSNLEWYKELLKDCDDVELADHYKKMCKFYRGELRGINAKLSELIRWSKL